MCCKKKHTFDFLVRKVKLWLNVQSIPVIFRIPVMADERRARADHAFETTIYFDVEKTAS